MTATTARRIPASMRACPAWRRASLVVARFQGDDGGPAVCERPGGGQSLRLGVWFAFALVVSLTGDPTRRIQQDAADRGVRAGRAEPGRGQRDGAPHRGEFGRRSHQAPRVSARAS